MGFFITTASWQRERDARWSYCAREITFISGRMKAYVKG
jgi:hypothetical protein